jgi:hypothetical protein
LDRQPTPNVTRADVERIARRDFPSEGVSTVLKTLDRYASTERSRVQLAVLKLAAGDVDAVHHALEVALRDPRDVLCGAEYPAYTEKWLESEELSPEERKRLFQADWQQYQDWLLAE